MQLFQFAFRFGILLVRFRQEHERTVTRSQRGAADRADRDDRSGRARIRADRARF